MKLTSGKKKVYVVANMQDDWITSTTTTAQFEAVTLTHCTKAGRIAHTKGVETAVAVSRVVILIKYPVMGMRRPMVS